MPEINDIKKELDSIAEACGEGIKVRSYTIESGGLEICTVYGDDVVFHRGDSSRTAHKLNKHFQDEGKRTSALYVPRDESD
jgi:hypothetical protein